MNLKSARFDEMQMIGEGIADEIFKLENILKRHLLFQEDRLIHYVLGYFRYKMGTKPLRAYTTWKFSKYLEHEKNKAGGEKEGINDVLKEQAIFSVRLPLVFELVITIQYIHNHILDEKLDAHRSNHPMLCKKVISGNILREVLFTYIEEKINPHIGVEKAIVLNKAIRELLLSVDIGQRIDKQYNTFHTWKNKLDSLPIIDSETYLHDELARSLVEPIIAPVKQSLKKGHDFADLYFHRIYLTNVCFFRVIAEVTVSLTEATSLKASKDLVNFSILYGFMLQIINDYADFAYSPDEKEREHLKTAGKKTTDFFADLYNFNVTLPLIFHLQQDARRNIEAYLANNRRSKKILNTYPKQIMDEIVMSGGIRKSISLSRKFSKAAVSHLTINNPASPYLENMCDMAMNNKFYNLFK